MKILKKSFSGGRNVGMLFALIGLIVFFHIISGGRMVTGNNALNLVNGNSYILVLAIGMVLVIVAGHIDLSVGSVAAFVGITVAILIRDLGLNWWMGLLLGLSLGALVGAWQGFWVSIMGIPAFIVTLAGMLIFRGLNQAVGNSRSVSVPEDFKYLGSGYLPEIGNIGYNLPTLLLGAFAVVWIIYSELKRRRSQRRLGTALDPLAIVIVKIVIMTSLVGYITYLFAAGRYGTSFPVPGLLLLLLALIYKYISERTVLGRHIYAVGGNLQAAVLSGVNTRKVNFLVMMNMSILAAFAGMMFIGRSGGSGPSDGVGWELDAIAAVFVGGAAVSGGVGTIVGSVIGGTVIAVLSNGLLITGVSADRASIIKGLVLLIAVALDVHNKNKGRPSIIGLLLKKAKNNPNDNK